MKGGSFEVARLQVSPCAPRHPMTWRALYISFFSYMAAYDVASTILQSLDIGSRRLLYRHCRVAGARDVIQHTVYR